MKPANTLAPQAFYLHFHQLEPFLQAQKESKSESELDEMWWKMAGELVAKYYAAREEVEKDVEGILLYENAILEIS